jgi:RimJ/RimL family protein N-acetyltransferase
MTSFHTGVPRTVETLILPTGYRATISWLTTDAKPLLEAAMLRLSPESSRRRFFTPRFRLSERELAFLTSPDGIRHYALGVCGRADDGKVEGIATARFVRVRDEPSTAEIAITVIDPFQRMGIGKALLVRLARGAALRGIERLRALILPDNAPAIALISKYAPTVRFTYDGELVRADIPLVRYAVSAAA